MPKQSKPTPIERCRTEVGRLYKFMRAVNCQPKPAKIVWGRQVADRLEQVSIALRDHLRFLESQGDVPLQTDDRPRDNQHLYLSTRAPEGGGEG